MEAFDRVRTRFLLPWFAVATILGIIPTMLIWPEWLDDPDPSNPFPDSVYALVFSTLLVGVSILRARTAGLRVGDLYPHFPAELAKLCGLAIPMLGVTLLSLYLFYAPLSLVAPEFVQSWVLDEDFFIYSSSQPYPWLGNSLGFIAVVLVVPVAEEWFFRGLLLRRWVRKWGARTAVIGSSALFAILHADLIGTFVFAVVMCGLYAKSRSLWAPTVVHSATNGLAWLLVAEGEHGGVIPALHTVAELRAAWWLPVLGALLVLPWAATAFREYRPISSWQFTCHATQQADPTNFAGGS